VVPFAFCQQATLYKLKKDDISHMQERAEVLRAAGDSGWEQAYIAIARAEWANDERPAALSRLIVTMGETQDCEQRGSAFRAALKAVTAAASDQKDTKEYSQLVEDFSLHCKKIFLQLPISEQSMSNGCAASHAATLASAALFWENRDQGAAEKAAENMIALCAFLPPPEGDDTKSNAHLILSRIAEMRGKYELAYQSYEAAWGATNFTRLDAAAESTREIMLTERVRLLSLHQPKVSSTRAAIATRIQELQVGTLPWSERAELFAALFRPMELEGMTTERIDGMLHFVQTAPQFQVATLAENAQVADFLSRLQGADHVSIGRPDAALLAYDYLIARASNQADQDQLTTQRNAIAQRLGL
jgi:hypothetical protein